MSGHTLCASLRMGLAAVGAAATLGLAGCGGAGHGAATHGATGPASTTSSSATTTSSAPPAPRRHRRRRARPRGAPVGSTLRVHAGSSTLLVTVSKVLDPLTDTGSKLLPGDRATGVQVSIQGVAGDTYDSTASGDWSILTTAGLASPLFVRQGVCQTPLADFESLVGVGETRDGCVAFSVPRHARILSVRFSPHSRAPGTVAWR
ncbi:MAG TPA: hypothetical protein VMF14_20200 [Solirubrobacteraceae bacterium]|nr:hypothetical protein [Solirubrobacteraceae bacterium]